jgi:L-fuculose-phosphate aldolase
LSQQLRQKLADAGKALVIEGQDDFVAGHVSARLPDNPNLFLMKPANIGLEEMMPDDLLTIGLDGKVVAGTARRHNEVYLHSEIFRARPDVNCVVHTHPVNAIMFSALDLPLLPVSNEGVIFHNALPVFSEVTDVITTPALGAALAHCLGDKQAVLLRNHGIATVGATVEEAVWLALKLERACQMQLLVAAAGGPKVLHTEDLEKGRKRRVARPDLHASVFNLLVRRWQRGQFTS